MPRAAKTTTQSKKEWLSRAKKKREAKARERAAKAAGVSLDSEETVRAKKVARAGFAPEEWARFLEAFAKEYAARRAHRTHGHDGTSDATDAKDKDPGDDG
jgi:hypothetical protein